MLEVLSFYANSKIYWGNPLRLDLNLDLKTLRLCNESKESSEIMKDKGELARDALFEFEGVFKCEYDVQTEI